MANKLDTVPKPRGGSLVDHLPSPKKSTHKHEEVPYACFRERYDDGPFLGYDERQGWSATEIHDPTKSGRAGAEIACFFQNWFFFGLLSDTLGAVVVADFITPIRERETVLTTRRLPEFMLKWYDRMQKLPLASQRLHLTRIDNNLWRICNVLSDWNLHEKSPLTEWAMLYYNMLGQHLQTACRSAFSGLINGPHDSSIFSWDALIPDCFSPDRRWPTVGYDAVRSRMIEDGWCRSDVQRLCSTMTTNALYFASRMQPPGSEMATDSAMSTSKLSHTTSVLKQMHSECTDFTCLAYQYSEPHYHTKHVRTGCTCPHYEVDTRRINRILDDGELPLIRIFEYTLRSARVEVITATSAPRYVAISHVWSDGLGNPYRNSLPWCQLLKLAFEVEDLYNDGLATAFWIDTLCCPAVDELRRAKAIRLMKDTYAQADRVLVLESYLQSQRTTALLPSDMMMMIFCCKWQRRLWCLQERLLPGPKKVFFRFADRGVNPSDLLLVLACARLPRIASGDLAGLPRFPEGTETLSRTFFQLAVTLVADVCRHIYIQDQLIGLVGISTSVRMTALQSYLSFRSTSKASDEAVILATMLDVDIGAILRIPRSDYEGRMEVFWTELSSSIPPHVIFWIGPKLQKQGLRWAPATFLTGRDLTHCEGLDTTRSASLTTKGLLVRYPGWSIGPAGGFQIRAQFIMIDNADKAYLVSCLDGQTRQYLPPRQILDLPELFQQKGVMQLAIISEYDLDEADDRKRKVSHDALLVVGFEEGVAHVAYVNCVHLVTIRKLDNEVGWVAKWLGMARLVLRDATERQRKYGLWAFHEDGAVDTIGCLALLKEKPWCVD